MVLDTKVLLSGISYSRSIPGKILAAWRRKPLEVLLSVYILGELRRVLPRLAYRHGLNPMEQGDLVDVLAIQAEVITPLLGHEPALRDLHDQLVPDTLLAALKTSGADYLITGDKDLLALAGEYPIIAPATFWEKHGAS